MDAAMLKQLKEELARKKEVSKMTGGGGETLFYKIPKEECEITVRILPGKDNSVISFLTGKHWNLKGEDESLPCIGIEHGMECPICKAIQECEGGTIDFYEQKPRGQTYVNALILRDSTLPEKDQPNPKLPHILRLPESLHWRIIELLLDDEVGDHICNVKDGVNVVFKRVSSGKRVDVAYKFKRTPLADTEEEIKSILAKTKDVSKFASKVDDKLKKSLENAADAIYQEVSLAKTSISTPAADVAQAKQDIKDNVAQAVQASVPKSAEKPVDAPDCWGNYVQDQDKCICCPFDIVCEEASK